MEVIQSPTKTKARKKHTCDYCCAEIPKGTEYLKAVLKYDEVYSWKSHRWCSKIASKLNMFDHSEEGVTSDDFHENIKNEYQNIMANYYTEIYESKEFVYPNFNEKLSFVLNHYGILINP